MRTSRNTLTILLLAGFIGTALYFQNTQSENRPGTDSVQESGDHQARDVAPRQFAGYDCTADCSGHEAGYKWAQEHDISDGDDCDAAGEHSSSSSFAEGCHAYVYGEPEPDNEDGQDTDD
jgi:hypothetical protein